ncbi:MAG: hypothetical protein C5B53_03005 [Candidatus Melainabacteria bacterium]|nr:MAG: hypothetical protein C5B53_03005 [Candidatus Melainabacteria bacterium]
MVQQQLKQFAMISLAVADQSPNWGAQKVEKPESNDLETDFCQIIILKNDLQTSITIRICDNP